MTKTVDELMRLHRLAVAAWLAVKNGTGTVGVAKQRDAAIRSALEELVRRAEFDATKREVAQQADIALHELRAALAEPGQAEPVPTLVSRFLSWQVPDDVCADPCACRPGEGRAGTNLLTATQAEQMLRHVLEIPR